MSQRRIKRPKLDRFNNRVHTLTERTVLEYLAELPEENREAAIMCILDPEQRRAVREALAVQSLQ
ncbi:MAG TPA: hypothetical protein VGR40_04395 [Candidatus Binatus sp.]|nr:hypothetical protein [Candidatus Binatus sp.]